MGFNNAGLGPSDQMIVQSLQPVIISTLRKASTSIRNGGGIGESRKWFGDQSGPWMAKLAQQLGTLASLINVKPIDVAFQDFQGRCSDEYASAMRPAGGWNDFTGDASPMTTGQAQNFRIFLNHNWNSAPLYRPFKRPADSKFQTLVHECTHLFINTDDDAYGVPDCEVTAAVNPNMAKKTADNWGYFVEEFRTGG
ncbi:M35 family metallo-endopeptidase [Rubrivirga sp.]|uniref:M35 family metallo-endopeptidase n=1 Tax=Rubrivirga sp. TaxID=1885344 RepID=UPI003C772DE4